MTVTYPRELPSYRLADIEIGIVANVAAAASGRGAKINLSQVDDPTWRLRITTAQMRLDTGADWIAWYNSLRGGFGSFLAFDLRRKRPRAYPTAEAPGDISPGWSGLGAVTALGLSGALSLSGLPAGYQIRPGDRIGIEQGSPLKRGYYEASEAATASGGGAVTVTVAPFLHTAIFSVGATARLWQPKCEFSIDWASWSQGGEPNAPAFSFEAWQKL